MQKQESIIDLREKTNHPLSLRYSEVYDSAILEGSFHHGRVQPGMSLGDITPFIGAARVALQNGLEKKNTLSLMHSYLSRYYERVSTNNSSDWLGLKNHQKFQNIPPWGAVFPWRARTIESYKKAYENAALHENQAVGFNADISAGWLFCGPVASEKISVEAKRILYVLQRIKNEGYKRSDVPDGDIKATALVNNQNNWRWVITAGNHRAAAAAALGMESVPIRVNLVISRSDANYWKHVVDGLFTLEEALYVFDNYFDANAIELTNPWFASIKINHF